MLGKDGDFKLHKIQMHHLLRMPIGQIPTFSLATPKDIKQKMGYLNIVVAQAYSEWSNSPCSYIYRASLSVKTGQMPLFPT